MSTLHEIKAAAATLPASERSELVTWLSESKDVWEIRREQLRREIQIGLDEIERGECVECKDDGELRSFIDGVKARGRELLAAQKPPTA